MSDKSTIESADATWNPVRGCTKVSPGCAHCYAETFAERFRGVPGRAFEQGYDIRLVPEQLFVPLNWRKPKRIFVNSMSDMFHEQVFDGYILKMVEVMETANWHTYLVLTKRSARMLSMLNNSLYVPAQTKHIWWGVSVEDKRHGLPRIKHLQAAPCRSSFPFDRASARRPRHAGPHGHSLGDCRRRERPRRSAYEGGLGDFNSRSMRSSWHPVLLPAVERGAKEQNGTFARRSDLRRLSVPLVLPPH